MTERRETLKSRNSRFSEKLEMENEMAPDDDDNPNVRRFMDYVAWFSLAAIIATALYGILNF